MLNNIQSPVTHSIYRFNLKQKIAASQKKIRENNMLRDAKVVRRTEATNSKCNYQTQSEEQTARQEVVAEQIRAWRRMLPTLIRRFSRIPDPRRPKSVKHKLVVLMLFGLFAFVFRLHSRREMNRELTGAVIYRHLQKIFPELDSIPHADTLARLLKKTSAKEIERAHIGLVKELIRSKKFKQLLINKCLPLSIDGAQKLFRKGLLHDSHWLQRKVGHKDNQTDQQYVYALEANITLKNGLNIPLISEYLSMENNQLLNPQSKQDCELRAFERLAKKLKYYFPRLKLIFFMDALYATQGVMTLLNDYGFEYVIKFSKNKHKYFSKQLSKKYKERIVLPNQPYYRSRKQAFYWANNVKHGYASRLKINLVACMERWEGMNAATGAIEIKRSQHTWITSIPLSNNNIYELCNCGARKKECIEDSFNTEKNRGYRYKHAFAYNWNAMKCFHHLMRLGHALNALSMFVKKLKQYVKENGCSALLNFIKVTLFSPWLTNKWFEQQYDRVPQLRFQME